MNDWKEVLRYSVAAVVFLLLLMATVLVGHWVLG